MGYLLAVDTGGTFTDLVAYDRESGSARYAKALTDHRDLVEGVMECLAKSGVTLDQAKIVKHGTTQVINAFIQRKGAKTALITTRGFRDVLEIGRANRPIPFKLKYRRDPPLVPRPLRFEVAGRIDGVGRELEPLDEVELLALAQSLEDQGVEALAVSFVNAYANPAHEERAVAVLGDRLPGCFVTAGSQLSREWYEYERTATAAANAYVGPGMKRYIERFAGRLKEHGFGRGFHMMASNGGVLSVERSLAQPVALVESGPVGGCMGAKALARELDLDNLIAFDMGGTTAKSALIEGGEFQVQPTYYVGGYEQGFPVRASVLDIVEVGAGGGSIARVDTQGRLRVGPESAGSDPGPVAFGRGGVMPTVTDANLLAGRIIPGTFLGGAVGLDTEAAARALTEQIAAPLGMTGDDALDALAEGIVSIAITTMAGAIRQITLERGRDVREFALFAYGGGGPLHAQALARALHIPLVIVPPQPGNFSAIGMLLANARIDDAHSMVRDLTQGTVAEINQVFAAMEARAGAALADEMGAAQVFFERHAELRYKGQHHSIKVSQTGNEDTAMLAAAFQRDYGKTYGHVDPDIPLELIGLGIGATAMTERPEIGRLRPSPAPDGRPEAEPRSVYFSELGGRVEARVYDRDTLALGFAGEGPAIIHEYGATTLIGPADRFEVGRQGEIRIDCS